MNPATLIDQTEYLKVRSIKARAQLVPPMIKKLTAGINGYKDLCFSNTFSESEIQILEPTPSCICIVDVEPDSIKSPGPAKQCVAGSGGSISTCVEQRCDRTDFLPELFTENVVAKIWGIASGALDRNSPPEEAPEYTQPGDTKYKTTGVDFWTSGFFPGSLYLLLERAELYPKHFPCFATVHKQKLLFAARWWSDNLHEQARRTDTHDLGFMIQPSFQKDWELTGNRRSFNTLVTASQSLASRYDARVGAIRSWDTCHTKRYQFGPDGNHFLVIIDNMLNLDILFYVASKTGDSRLASIATKHAETTLKQHIRSDWSTVHVVNFDQQTGDVIEKITNQGLSDDSTWSRGQAWGILGFAQAYGWTGRKEFLNASKELARYFISRLDPDGVPHWDFDAPRPTFRDTSAAMICVSGLLELYKHTYSKEEDGEGREWISAAKWILNSTLVFSLSDSASFKPNGSVEMGGFDAILKNATINNHEYAPRRWADHGLVYADYFLLQVGNKLLQMGLV